jgi:hypothetical protein
MTLHKLGITALLIASFGAPAALADIPDLKTYTINFTTTSGSPSPTTGTFTYDPDTATFTAFTVEWDGLSFDLTASANSPTVGFSIPSCITGTGGAASFALMTGSCAPPPSFGQTDWQADASGHDATFGFITEVMGCCDLVVYGNASPIDAPTVHAFGTWTVTQQTSPVPEPSSLILLAPVCALLARRRIGTALRRATTRF